MCEVPPARSKVHGQVNALHNPKGGGMERCDCNLNCLAQRGELPHNQTCIERRKNAQQQRAIQQQRDLFVCTNIIPGDRIFTETCCLRDACRYPACNAPRTEAAGASVGWEIEVVHARSEAGWRVVARQAGGESCRDCSRGIKHLHFSKPKNCADCQNRGRHCGECKEGYGRYTSVTPVDRTQPTIWPPVWISKEVSPTGTALVVSFEPIENEL